LRGDAIIAAALATGARAIHPGYGFLSENPEFVEEVAANGLVFIGPSATAIRAMGLKDAAKRVMTEAGVPVVPGYHGADQTPATLTAAAAEIGYPVLIKAVAGGGGKGMRLVERPGDFEAALDSARSEATSAFGNGDVLVEKFIANPRHIEVQVFGDGNDAVHLFERDCSLQRRHQKVIEEAPAPGMTEDVREAMGQAAVRAARAIGYSGAGTVEFIVDGSGDLRRDGFFFMEMNTRLQVEHPVTEAITGIDLVEWQLRVAAGEPLPLAQEHLSINGHAVEARLYAEDVPAGFLPATGRLDHLAFPDGARADTGVRSGDVISPYYDPMLAKLIVHGPTRAVALTRIRQALAGCEVAGTVTNLAFLGALAAHEGFGRGDFDTGLIARDIATLIEVPKPEARHWIAAAQALLGLAEPSADAGFTLWQPLRHRISLCVGEEAADLAVEVVGSGQQRWTLFDTEMILHRIDGVWRTAEQPLPRVHVTRTGVTVFDRFGLRFERVDVYGGSEAEAASGNVIATPMPGLLKALSAVAGQTVKQGERLAVLEAMKMEHSLRAPRDGVIAEVIVREGEQVASGAALIVLKDEGA
jgi:3-methylcrotonyl-CoA carboxylase alpha subunit